MARFRVSQSQFRLGSTDVTTCQHATSLGSAGSGVMEWDGTRSDDGAGMGGVALDWVFTVEGGARVRVCRDGQGVMRGGQNESGWVGIGESLTSTP